MHSRVLSETKRAWAAPAGAQCWWTPDHSHPSLRNNPPPGLSRHPRSQGRCGCRPVAPSRKGDADARAAGRLRRAGQPHGAGESSCAAGRGIAECQRKPCASCGVCVSRRAASCLFLNRVPSFPALLFLSPVVCNPGAEDPGPHRGEGQARGGTAGCAGARAQSTRTRHRTAGSQSNPSSTSRQRRPTPIIPAIILEAELTRDNPATPRSPAHAYSHPLCASSRRRRSGLPTRSCGPPRRRSPIGSRTTCERPTRSR